MSVLPLSLRALTLVMAYALASACGSPSTSATDAPQVSIPTLQLTLKEGTRAALDDENRDDAVRVEIGMAERRGNSPRWGEAPERTHAVGQGVVRLHGSTSRRFRKKSYRLKLDEPATLVGMPAHREWVLISCFADRTYLKNALVYELARRVDPALAPRSRYVELVIDGRYAGLYLLTETVRIGPTRVARPPFDGRTGQGGIVVKREGEDEGRGKRWEAGGELVDEGVPPRPRPLAWTLHEPKAGPESLAVAHRLTDELERRFRVDGVAGVGPGGLEMVDLASFVDYWLFQELSENQDAFFKSVFLHSAWDGRAWAPVRFGPLWDFDGAFGGAAGQLGRHDDDAPVECRSHHLVHATARARNLTVLSALVADPMVRARASARWRALRRGPLSTSSIDELLGRLHRLIAAAVLPDQTLVSRTIGASPEGDCTRPFGANPGAFSNGFRACACAPTHDGEVALLATRIHRRLAFLDGYFDELGAPPSRAPAELTPVPGFSHTVRLHAFGLAYSQADGTVAVGRWTGSHWHEAGRRTIRAGFTNVVATSDGLAFFYDAASGVAGVGAVDRAGAGFAFDALSGPPLDAGWTTVLAVGPRHLSLSRATGEVAVVRIAHFDPLPDGGSAKTGYAAKILWQGRSPAGVHPQ